MTKTEAIDHLKDIAYTGISSVDEYNAVQLAIKTLKADLDMTLRIETIISQIEWAKSETVETLCYQAYEDALNIIRKNLKED